MRASDDLKCTIHFQVIRKISKFSRPGTNFSIISVGPIVSIIFLSKGAIVAINDEALD